MRKRKIVYISGTRADFGLMSSVLKSIEKNRNLKLDLYTTGMHLMKDFGYTIERVKRKFPGVKILDAIFRTDDKQSMARFFSDLSVRLVRVFEKSRPDIILVEGDRAEMLCVASCALYSGIPIAHIHGGEKTLTNDEITRHAITKLSHIHFVATKDAAKRIEKIGEEKWRIFVVGAPSLDTILNKKLPAKDEVFSKLNLDPRQKFILVTQHPVGHEPEKSGFCMEEIIVAVKTFFLPVVIIYPNADPGSVAMIEAIEKEKNNPLFRIFPNLDYELFLALEREAAVWIGNSSAMMIESSSFHTPVVNIGPRQKGRLRGRNVIDVSCSRSEIIKAIDKSLNDKEYRAKVALLKNPWGDGRTGERIARILEKLKIDSKLFSKQITY